MHEVKSESEERVSQDLASLVSASLDSGLAMASRRAEQLSALTESSVLFVGESLERIVRDAQSYADSARATLERVAGSDDGTGIAQLIAAQNNILSAYVDQMRTRVSHQAQAAEAAVKASSKIRSLGNQISSVASQSRLLSLNASIEAARLGQSGRAFGVIAAEMTNLSRQVESTSRAVNTLVANLSETLPQVADAASEMQSSSEVFMTEIGESIACVDAKAKGLEDSVQETLTSGDECIAKILSKSQDALSGLQFQDPLAQGLVLMTRGFNEAASQVAALVAAGADPSRLVDPEAGVPPPVPLAPTPVEAQDELLVEAGEILLF